MRSDASSMGREINNLDLALHKVTKITESKTLEFHFETFNTFNHAQFNPNGSIDRHVSSPTFGHVLSSVTAHWTSGVEIKLLAEGESWPTIISSPIS